MTTLIGGLIHATGEPDVGKTSFGLECGAPPERIAFIDDDIKGAPTARELAAQGTPFALYRDLVALGRGMDEEQLHGIGTVVIGEIEAYAGELDAIIWDTWSRFAKTCHPWVVAHPRLFRKHWSPMGTIKGAQQWLSSFDYEAQIIARLCAIAPLVILTTHLKAAYRGNVRIPDRFVPDCTRAVTQKARFRVWLRRNPDSPQPIGLVLKRLSQVRKADNGGIEVVNVLPLRMKPCTWAEIGRYWADPMGDHRPTAEETPDEFELSLLQGTLTEDQERTFRLMLRQGAFGEEEVATESGAQEETEEADDAPATATELLIRTGMSLAQLFPDLPAGERFRAKNEMEAEEVREKWEKWEEAHP